MIAIWLLNDELKYVMAKKYGLDSLFTVFSSNSDDIEFILYFFLKISSIYQILVTNERATKSCYKNLIADFFKEVGYSLAALDLRKSSKS